MAKREKREKREKDQWDRLLEQIDFHGMTQEEVVGQDGLIKQLTGRILQRALECETGLLDFTPVGRHY
jgi:hypothetical protein